MKISKDELFTLAEDLIDEMDEKQEEQVKNGDYMNALMTQQCRTGVLCFLKRILKKEEKLQ